MLLAPLGLADDVDVVIVPTGGLHSVAWSALPSLAGRPTTVAPSATIWLGAHGPAAPRRAKPRTAIVAGPDLPGADAEVRQLHELYPGAETLSGAEATAERVLAALERADLAHLAAHGRFRADSPLFSSIRLFDGPLTIYDLERLGRAPSTVVLSACDAGAVAVRTGDELLGTAAAMIGLGVRWVIAPVMAVPDEATTPFMLALHEGLRRGRHPARGARPGRQRRGRESPPRRSSASGAMTRPSAHDDRRDQRGAAGPHPDAAPAGRELDPEPTELVGPRAIDRGRPSRSRRRRVRLA